MVRFCFRYEIYGYEIYGRRCEIYGSLRDLWEGLRDLWEFARFMGVTRFMGRTTLKCLHHVICESVSNREVRLLRVYFVDMPTSCCVGDCTVRGAHFQDF